MDSGSDPKSTLAESQTFQASAPKDAKPGDPQQETSQASKSDFKPEEYVSNGALIKHS